MITGTLYRLLELTVLRPEIWGPIVTIVVPGGCDLR